ncbi:MAG: GntR family transcriptional regulator [Clostridiales bacterium]|nr:GntR family transcriptional regulator [Clostridiales bacterium]
MLTKRIFEQVRELIEEEARDKKPGEALDTEVNYARRFGVSRPTVRKAVEDLISIGLISRIPGKGLVMAVQDETPYRGKLLIAIPCDTGDGFLFRVMMGCVEEANLLGFDYKILSTKDSASRLEQVKHEHISDFCAVITCCYEEDAEYELISYLKRKGLPVILIDNPPRHIDVPCITCDDYDGGYKMGTYLAKKGHRSIINISIDRPVLTIERRNKGFLQAMEDASVNYDKSLIINGTQEFYSRFTPRDFKSGKYTAICSHTSLMIYDISGWLYKNGLSIYDDVSIMGYGDLAYVPMQNVFLTSIGVPIYEMGKGAVEEISEAILAKRPVKSRQYEVWIDKRHTVKRVND